MRYVPKPQPGGTENNVNVSKRHPLVEMTILLGGAFALILAIYGILGLSIDLAARHLPVSAENRLAPLGDSLFPEAIEDDDRAEYVSGIVNKLLKSAEPDGRKYRVSVLDYADGVHHPPNAVALPGGRIVVFCGLLEQAESENELAMVLSHELGHFHHRHHLRSLGRGLVAGVISLVLLGEDSGVSQFFMGSMSVASANYSQSQESEADVFGLDLLNKAYGQVAGATAFFARHINSEPHPAINAFLSTHPLSSRRVEALEGIIKDRDYTVGPLLAVPEGLQCRFDTS